MRAWREEEVFGKKAFVILLDTKGCYWRSCYMCGYNNEEKNYDDVMSQIERALELYKGEDIIKVFTSGSFLDTREISRDERRRIFGMLPDAEITVETRPEFVTENALEDMKEKRMEVAIGLESASDAVLGRCVNKGFSVKDFAEASERIRERKLRVKAYLLLKPPYMSENGALEDLKRSIDFCTKYADTVSINPVNVQKGTVVEKLWFEGRYRPPWLWSLVDALLYSQRYLEKIVVTSMPSGGGSRRGVHNCFACDRDFLERIDKCRIEQNYDPLQDLRCDCIEKWKDFLELERYVYSYPLYD